VLRNETTTTTTAAAVAMAMAMARRLHTSAVKDLGLVLALGLGTEVVYHVVFAVARLEEAYALLPRVAVDGLASRGREAERDDVVGNVCVRACVSRSRTVRE